MRGSRVEVVLVEVVCSSRRGGEVVGLIVDGVVSSIFE